MNSHYPSLPRDAGGFIHNYYQGQSAMHRALFDAIDRGDIKEVDALLNRKVIVNRLFHQNGWSRTPLQQAVNQLQSNSWAPSHSDAICLLVEHGADINIKDNYGDTALSVAIKDANTQLVEYLLSHGGKLNLTTKEGCAYHQLPTSRETYKVIQAKLRETSQQAVMNNANEGANGGARDDLCGNSETICMNLAGTLCEMLLNRIPAGSFMMGKPTDKDNIPSTYLAQHFVTLTKDFWIGQCPVTQEQWETLMGKPPDDLWLEYGTNFFAYDFPVVGVSWCDAMAFCRKLTDEERNLGILPRGYVFSLPTEAQWEYACRAGTTGAYNVEGANVTDVGWFGSYRSKNGHLEYVRAGNNCDNLQAVGLKLPNVWGLYDMHGNVAEWCSDWSGDYSTSAAIDPVGPCNGTSRIVRGGTWWSRPNRCLSYSRRCLDPGRKYDWVGFRVCLSPAELSAI